MTNWRRLLEEEKDHRKGKNAGSLFLVWVLDWRACGRWRWWSAAASERVLQMAMEMVMMRMVTAMMGMEMVMRMVVMIVTAMMEMMMVSAFGPAIICPYGQPRSPAKWLKLHQESTFIHHLPLSASKPQTRCIWIVDQLTGSGTIAWGSHGHEICSFFATDQYILRLWTDAIIKQIDDCSFVSEAEYKITDSASSLLSLIDFVLRQSEYFSCVKMCRYLSLWSVVCSSNWVFD